MLGFLGNLLGIGSSDNDKYGSAGQNFKPQAAPIQQTVTPDQLAAAYQATQGGLTQQQAFANALAGQNGIGNQQQVFAQQQALAQQLQDQANGVGPNPAQAALAQSTSNNIANQAALMAGQRGAGANAGLIARQAAQQGAGIQQQAVGQAATMEAQQQLAARQQLQAQQQAMAQLAGTQVGQQGQAISGVNQAAQNLYGNQLGAIGNFNNANIASTSNQNNISGQIASGISNQQSQMGSQFINSLGGAALKGAGMAAGGMVPKRAMYADGGPVSSFGQAMYGAPIAVDNSILSLGGTPSFQAGPDNGASGDLGASAGKGAAGILSKLLGPGSGVGTALPMGAADLGGGTGAAGLSAAGNPIAMVAKGGMMTKGGKNMKKGGPVPGQAKVKGDSYANDTVPAMLSPGEVVIPRHVMQSKDPVNGAAAFVQAVLAKQQMKGK